jgi:type II secretory pathway component GspD/PulD (secretin)
MENSGRTVKEWERKRRKPVFGGSFDRKNGGTISISLLNNAVDLDFMLSMLHSLEEAKLLASPRVMVLDNEQAIFETVREIPYTERTNVAGSGGTITSTKFKPVGVKLNVTPHIARDGMIRLKIEPEFGVVVDLNHEGAPTIDTRRAVTTNMIRDGQTIVLGGLRKSEMRKEVDKVPLLGDIPILGALFRGESESEMTTELVVFITTSIVETPKMTPAEEVHLETTSRMISEISSPKPKKSSSWLKPKKADEEVSHEYIDKWMDAKRKKAASN